MQRTKWVLTNIWTIRVVSVQRGLLQQCSVSTARPPENKSCSILSAVTITADTMWLWPWDEFPPSNASIQTPSQIFKDFPLLFQPAVSQSFRLSGCLLSEGYWTPPYAIPLDAFTQRCFNPLSVITGSCHGCKFGNNVHFNTEIQGDNSLQIASLEMQALHDAIQSVGMPPKCQYGTSNS